MSDFPHVHDRATLGGMTANERRLGRYIRDGAGHPNVPLEMMTWIKSVEDKLKEKGVEAHTLAEMEARLFYMEQRDAQRRHHAGSASDHSTLGDAFAGADGLKAFAAERERPGRFKIETKAVLTSATAAAAGSAGAVAAHAYRDAIVMIPKTRLTVRSLIPVIPIETSSVEIPKHTNRNNQAGMVAEGALKPESDMSFQMVSVPVRKIAHWTQASSEILADGPLLAGTINDELLYGLAVKEDRQLLNGDGSGQNLTGLTAVAMAYAAPIVITTPNAIDTLGLGMLQVALGDFVPDGIILHPSDWTRIRLLKDGQGKYLLGDPGEVVEPRLFGLPVVATQAMAVGHFMVGQFQVAATIYDRMQAVVVASTEDRDNFVRNLVTLLAEERLGLGIKQPTALVYGSF